MKLVAAFAWLAACSMPAPEVRLPFDVKRGCFLSVERGERVEVCPCACDSLCYTDRRGQTWIIGPGCKRKP